MNRESLITDHHCSNGIGTGPHIQYHKVTINIGCGTEMSIRDLVKLVMDVTGVKAEVISNKQNDPGVSRMCADLSLARSKLGYKPHFSLSEGLRLTIERDSRFQQESAAQPTV